MRVLPLLIGLLAASSAQAQNSQIKKAEAAYEAFSNGDPGSLDAALAAIDKASAHKKTSEKGSVWVLRGRVYTALALQDGVPSPEAIEAAVSSWEGAVERGAGKGAISDDLAKILSATTLIIRDDLEGKRIDDAWARVDAAMRGRTLLENVGWSDERFEGPLLQLAILTAVRADKMAEAKLWFADWRAMDLFEPSVAVQVAGGLAKTDADAGVSFLEPMLQERPLDPAMLTKVIELLLAADKPADALTRVKKASKAKGSGSSGSQLLLGHLYRMAGDDSASRAAFESALEQNPESAEAWLPLAELLLAESATLQEKIDGGELQRADQSEAEDQRAANLESAAMLLEKARDATAGNPAKEVWAVMVEVYGALGREEDKAAAQEALDKAE